MSIRFFKFLLLEFDFRDCHVQQRFQQRNVYSIKLYFTVQNSLTVYKDQFQFIQSFLHTHTKKSLLVRKIRMHESTTVDVHDIA